MTSPARVGEPAGRRGWAWWFVGIGVAALAARLYRIGAEPFWHDEAWTVTFSGKTQSEIWSWTPLDVGNPPLYYSILNAWRVLGDSEAVLRLPSVLIAVATLPVLYVTGRIVADRRVGLVAAALFAVSTYQVRYAQEARTYAWITFLTAVVMLSVAFLLTRPRETGLRRLAWLAYVLAVGLGLLSHNIVVFVLVAANLAVLLALRSMPDRRGFLRSWALAQLGVVVVAGVWGPGFARQWSDVYREFWIPEPSIAWIVRQGKELLADQLPASLGVLLGALVMWLAALGAWRLRSRPAWLGLLLAFLLIPVLGELVVSFVRPVFIARALIMALLPLYLLVAVGIASIASRAIAASVLVAVLALSVLGTAYYFARYDKPSTDLAAEYVRDRIRQGDAIAFQSLDREIPFKLYFGVDEIDEVPTTHGANGWAGTEGASRLWVVASGVRDERFLAPFLAEGRMVEYTAFDGVSVSLLEPEG